MPHLDKQNSDTASASEQALINTLRYIEHAEAAQGVNDRPGEVEFTTQRLRDQQAHLKVRNVLVDHLRDKLEHVADSVAQLRCLTDPDVMTALHARDTIIGTGISSVSFAVDVSIQLDQLSASMIGLVRELAKSDPSTP